MNAQIIEKAKELGVELITVWLPNGNELIALKEIADNLNIQNNEAINGEQFKALYRAHEFFFDCEGVSNV
jgi:hypothetical protein